MIKSLEIKNFKSIKHLTLDCSRVNLFIGEPNTGKSNILESLGLLSFPLYGDIHDFIRFENMGDLYYDQNLDESIRVHADNTILEISFKDGQFDGICRKQEPSESGESLFSFQFNYEGKGGSSIISNGEKMDHAPKFYKFSSRRDFPEKVADYLRPPSGGNLFTLLQSHKNLKIVASQLFEPFGLRLVYRIHENKLEIMKQQDDAIITYPYSSVSDTLQRILFHLIAIYSNKNSILIFEEPESHSFPYYTKFLGERIALDDGNQYFVATHNPYLLLAILEKAKKGSVSVFITYFMDYQTKVVRLTDTQISELMNYDPFFNLKDFIKEDLP